MSTIILDFWYLIFVREFDKFNNDIFACIIIFSTLMHNTIVTIGIPWIFLKELWPAYMLSKIFHSWKINFQLKCVRKKIFTIHYKTTLIFNQHTCSYFGCEIQSRGVEWVIFVELCQTWLQYDMHFGKKDACTSRTIDAAAAMATGPWIKAMWIIMGWLTNNARPVLFRILSLNEYLGNEHSHSAVY